jgi:hypothetical protein
VRPLFGWPYGETPGNRNDNAPRETYRQDMPVALAYALSSAPFFALGFGLLRLGRF